MPPPRPEPDSKRSALEEEAVFLYISRVGSIAMDDGETFMGGWNGYEDMFSRFGFG